MHVVNREGLVRFPAWELSESDPQEFERLEALYFDASWEQNGHLHRNWGGMSVLCEAMRFTGVLVEMQHGPWPARAWVASDDGETTTLTPEGRAFLSAGSGQQWRVPSWKFGSNDGWIVTPDECRWIAYALRTHPEPYVSEFGKFCAFAAQRGGFTFD